MEIKDKVIIITGASSGIGEAAARLLSTRGAKVVLAARREDRLRKLEEEIPDSLAVITDVTKPADITNLIAKTMERYGRVDGLVNNAGEGLHLPLEQVKLDDYIAVTELNVYGPLLLMQAVLPHLRAAGGGAIINISSGTTTRTIPGVGAYASTKCALNMLSRVAREEFAADNIVVSLLVPTITITEFHDVMRARSWGAGSRPGMPSGHTAEFVAEYILHCILTGETEIVLHPGKESAEI